MKLPKIKGLRFGQALYNALFIDITKHNVDFEKNLPDRLHDISDKDLETIMNISLANYSEAIERANRKN